jgi:ribonuclease-3
MFNNVKTNEIEEIIGYTFADKAILVRAFTHPSLKSAVNENYQTIEFLGDSILDFVIAEKLMLDNPDINEGELTKRRASVVSEQPLADAIGRVRLTEFMQFGIGERRHKIYQNDSVKSDLFEAIVGAIYLDGGIEPAKNFVLKMLDGAIKDATAVEDEHDAKSRLNEYASKHGLEVKYQLVSQSGPPHKPTFIFEVYVDGQILGNGRGNTKHSAQQWAAKEALLKLQ